MTNSEIDREVFQDLTEVVGEEFIGEMVDAFLEEGTQFISDLEKGFAEADIDLFRRAAHSLKSNAATFGAIKLSSLSEELEEMARRGQLDGAAEKLEPVSVAFSNAESALKEMKDG